MRTLLAGIVGGILMYLWASVAHLATPLGQMGVSQLPNESATVSALATTLGDRSGLFVFPWGMGGKSKAQPASGASGFLVYRANTPLIVKPATLVTEFGAELVKSIIAAILLSWAMIDGYLPRVGFVTLVGIAGAITTNLSYWNWYGFPTSYTLGYSAIQIIGYFVAGLAIAWLVPRRAAS